MKLRDVNPARMSRRLQKVHRLSVILCGAPPNPLSVDYLHKPPMCVGGLAKKYRQNSCKKGLCSRNCSAGASPHPWEIRERGDDFTRW